MREWAIQNAIMWTRDYRIDGLRLDAVHAIFDDESPVHVLRELRDRVDRSIVISEMGHDDFGRSRSGDTTQCGSTICITSCTCS